jgi:3-deoxy-7-phosphoheptulonate synthase
VIVSLALGADAAAVRRELAARGLWIEAVERGAQAGDVFLVVSSYSAAVDSAEIAGIPGVRTVSVPVSAHPRIDEQGPVVDVGGVPVGANPLVFAGPCSVESEEQILRLALRLSALGVSFLRGGAFKPRTSPYSFQGHGEIALGWMRRAAHAARLKVVTEAMSEADVPLVAEYADLVQIGSRNMQNFALLKAVGRSTRPALLKRGMAATVEEWLLAAEYLLSHGSRGVVLCERGIRGISGGETRNLLDLGAVALLSHVHRLPVIVDPSHGVGRRDLIAPLSRAALAAGAAGVMIEVHEDPGNALSDGPQALSPEQLAALMPSLLPSSTPSAQVSR